jgi:3-oxoadipate enol-lactonase
MIHVQEAGSGPAVLCLHGIGSSAESFRPQLDGLAGSARMFAWDAPGYGKSADPQTALDIEGFADAAADVIRERAGGPAHVLGVSWGGVIAQILALRSPELVKSLILVGSSRGSGRTAESVEAMRARVGALTELGADEFARKRAPRLLSEQAPSALVDQVVSTMATAIRLPGYGYAAESMATTDTSSRLREIRSPTLVLCGDADGVTGVVESQALAGGIPDAVFVTVSGAGHLANQERPESVNAWVSSYLHIIERMYA